MKKTEFNTRGFKGIWIPKEIWLNNSLSIQEKVFLVEIDSLSNENGGCYASNKYFSEFFGLSIRRCQSIIGGLIEKDLIISKIEFKPGTKHIQKRILTLKTPMKDCSPPSRTKLHHPHEENFLDITKYNNKVNNTNVDFKVFWDSYQHKVGNLHKTKSLWQKFDKVTKVIILDHIEIYKKNTPDKRFRKQPMTYLNSKIWESEDEWKIRHKDTLLNSEPLKKYATL